MMSRMRREPGGQLRRKHTRYSISRILITPHFIEGSGRFCKGAASDMMLLHAQSRSYGKTIKKGRQRTCRNNSPAPVTRSHLGLFSAQVTHASAPAALRQGE